MKDFLAELQWRKQIHNSTPDIAEALKKEMVTAYIGYDPTAPSLTIGNMVTIMLLARLQRAGHRPIVVLGGATGRIGDPSGKDAERQLLDLNIIEQNIKEQSKIFSKFLNFDEGENKAIFVNNYDFYKDMNVLVFLRDIGKHINIAEMLSKDSVRNRLERGLSFTEFSYQLIQGYDFQYLYKNYNCIIQMGGADQWGNITAGTEFIRKFGGKGHALTCPLLMSADGKKIGKTADGKNIWLSPNMTSPYTFYQYWLNAADSDMSKLLRTFSFKEQDEILEIEAKSEADPNYWKRSLAEELTCLVHSKESFLSAMQASEVLFNPRMNTDTLRSLSLETLEMVSAEIPHFVVNRELLHTGANIVDLLAVHAPILSSKAEVKRAIQNNAISINKEKINSAEVSISLEQLLCEKFIFVENGKKNKFLLIIQ